MFTDSEFARMVRETAEQVAAERERMIQVIAKRASTPPPMDAAEKLHQQLSRAFTALHAIARMECQTRPEDAAEEVERVGYRKPCRDDACGPCMAFRALIVEGQLPFSS